MKLHASPADDRVAVGPPGHLPADLEGVTPRAVTHPLFPGHVNDLDVGGPFVVAAFLNSPDDEKILQSYLNT